MQMMESVFALPLDDIEEQLLTEFLSDDVKITNAMQDENDDVHMRRIDLLIVYFLQRGKLSQALQLHQKLQREGYSNHLREALIANCAKIVSPPPSAQRSTRINPTQAQPHVALPLTSSTIIQSSASSLLPPINRPPASTADNTRPAMTPSRRPRIFSSPPSINSSSPLHSSVRGTSPFKRSGMFSGINAQSGKPMTILTSTNTPSSSSTITTTPSTPPIPTTQQRIPHFSLKKRTPLVTATKGKERIIPKKPTAQRILGDNEEEPIISTISSDDDNMNEDHYLDQSTKLEPLDEYYDNMEDTVPIDDEL